jgi:probable HAF family extracellular repeat protein
MWRAKRHSVAVAILCALWNLCSAQDAPRLGAAEMVSFPNPAAFQWRLELPFDAIQKQHALLRSLFNLHGTGTCLTGIDCWGRPLHVCFAPDTPEWYVEYVSRLIFGDFGPAYNLAARWTQTSYGSTDTIGTPIRLRWSVVPDGTLVPHFDPNIGFAPSNLIATLDAQFGNRATWWNLLRQSFARWSEVAGLRYEEVGDDGAPFPFSPGSPARGDVRIGGRSLDGTGGTLAFNYFPDSGDMVIDTDDYWADTTNNFRRFRNLVMHEHGHGLGLAHVIPTDCTKLMEPFLCTTFDGPQDDDIRGAQRLYGDRYEPNDRFDRATPLYLGYNDLQSVTEVSLHHMRDVDWYRLQVPSGVSLTITAIPVGATYNVGPQGGNPVTVDTRAVQNLVIELRAPDALTTLVVANANGRGGMEQIINYPVPGGGGFYLRVYSGTDSRDDVQRYELQIRTQSLPTPAVFIPLGFLPGGTASEAYAVSHDGSVVVGRARNSAGQWRAVRWSLSDGQILDLGTLGGSESEAYGISADGSVVVGWARNTAGQWRAFRWTAAGGMQDLGTLGGSESGAYGISADGIVVVGRANNAAGYARAFRWTRSSGMQDLGALGGGNSGAYGISADGIVVVGWASNAAWQGRAIRWTLGGMQELGTLGGSESVAYGISADGTVVVGWAQNTAGQQRAFRWTASGGMQDLGTLGATWSVAYAVSSDGRIVVGRSQNARGEYRAFLWTPEDGMQDLNSLFAHVIPPGWELTLARGMSPDGRFIVGWGLNPQGRTEAWFLDPLGCQLPGDVNRDRTVDDADLLAVLFAFGSSDPDADQNDDGVVDDADLLIVLFNFGSGC